jgi:hypothetical protein
MQDPMLTERKVIEISSSLNKIAAFERAGPGFGDFLEFWASYASTSSYAAMLAFEDLNREVLKI